MEAEEKKIRKPWSCKELKLEFDAKLIRRRSASNGKKEN